MNGKTMDEADSGSTRPDKLKLHHVSVDRFSSAYSSFIIVSFVSNAGVRHTISADLKSFKAFGRRI